MSITQQENESHRDAQPCAPGKFGRLSADLSEMSGEGEFLLPGTGRWSSAITHLTGPARLRYSKEVKEIFVVVRRLAAR